MIVPEFQLKQNDRYLFCTIHAPYTKVADVEIDIDGFDLNFYSKPYLLKLTFQQRILDEGSSCSFDADKGNYELSILKETENEFFTGLDFLTNLLNSKPPEVKIPKIEVLSESTNGEADDVELKDLSNIYGYGFANQKSNVFPKSNSDADILCLKNVDQLTNVDRITEMELAEVDQFDLTHYLNDWYCDDDFQYMKDFQPWWREKRSSDDFQFTEEERKIFLSLKNKDYLLSESEKNSVLMGLVSILFAYVYDLRFNEGDSCVESAWNIQKLSPVLSSCCSFDDVTSVFRGCFRRLLTYPLYRNYELGELVWSDVNKILRLGIKNTLRCLLSVRKIFEVADQSPYYLLNRLYIDDYCVWMQKPDVSDDLLKELAKEVKDTKIHRYDLNLGISAIEASALLQLESSDEEDVDDVDMCAAKVDELKL